MSKILTTGEALYAAICRHPEEDTRRLVYADWLDENGQEDRAEFIRVQCEWSSWERPGGMFEVPPTESGKKRLKWCLERENELLAAHPDWSRLPCPGCNGTGDETSDGQGRCGTCRGTGDLFQDTAHDSRPRGHARTLTFARGFVDSVTCRLDELDKEWAKKVVKHSPVVRFVVTDREPAEENDYYAHNSTQGLIPKIAFYWFNATRAGREWNGEGSMPFWIPGSMADELKGGIRFYNGVYYRTVEAAHDTLALAAGRVVRRAVYGGVV